MEPFLNRLNVILIAVVGALVVIQWSGENRADNEIIALRTSVRRGERQASVQAEALRRANEDIDDFKTVVAGLKAGSDDADTQIRQQKARVFTLERESAQRAAEAESLRRSVTAFKSALDERDTGIRTLLAQRQELIDAASDAAHKANSAVTLYNDLASHYQALVGKYNDLARRYQATAAAGAGGASDRSRPSDGTKS